MFMIKLAGTVERSLLRSLSIFRIKLRSANEMSAKSQNDDCSKFELMFLHCIFKKDMHILN